MNRITVTNEDGEVEGSASFDPDNVDVGNVVEVFTPMLLKDGYCLEMEVVGSI